MLQDASARYFISDGIITISFGASRPWRFCPFTKIQDGGSMDWTSQVEETTPKYRATIHINFWIPESQKRNRLQHGRSFIEKPEKRLGRRLKWERNPKNKARSSCLRHLCEHNLYNVVVESHCHWSESGARCKGRWELHPNKTGKKNSIW